MVIQVILVTSLVCYVTSSLLIVRTVQADTSRRIWVPLAAILLFTVRPIYLLAVPADALAPGLEGVLLAASVLLLVSVSYIPRLIADLRQSRRALQTAHDALEGRISERTEALHASTERLQTIVENLPVMVDALDENDTIVMWNRECERVTGYRAAEIVGNPRAFEMLYPDAEYRAAIWALLGKMGGEFHNLEIELTCKNGTCRTIAWSNVSRKHPIPGWRTWAMGIDVTQQKRAQQMLFQTQETLEQRVRDRTAALQAANEQLQREIAERQAAEEAEHEQRLLAEALRDTAQALNSTLELDEIFRRLLINIKPVMPHDAANIMLIDGDIARVVYAQGYAARDPAGQTPESISFSISHTPHMKHVVQTGQPHVIPDTSADPDWVVLDSTAWIRAYAIAPIHVEGEVIGFLNVDSATPNKFTARDAEHLQAFAAQAAIAARNARLYEQARRDLTERERAEIALRQSEEHLRATLNALADPVHVIDTDLRVILVNEAFKVMNLELGLETNAIGRTPFELFPFLPESARDEYRQVFASGVMLVTQEVTHAGSMRLITETRKIPIFSEGHVNRVVTITRDTTDQKTAEAALRESEQRYRMLFERSLAGVFRTALDGRILNCNEAFAHIFGYESPAEVLQLNVNDLYVTIGDRSAMLDALEKHGALSNLELRGQRKDGSVVWVLGEVTLVEEEGEPFVVEGTVVDITGRREAEEALRNSEERYRLVSDLVSDYAYSFHIEPDGPPTLEWMTEAFVRITGYTPEEMNTLGWDHFRHPDDLPLVQRRMATLHTGHADVSEFRLIRKDGKTRWVRDHALPIWDDDEGRVVRIIGAATDITDQKCAENQALLLAIEKERSRVLTDFITDTSHEFANPISVIKNALYLVHHHEDPEQRARHLKSIVGQVYHIEKLVEGLTTMSRLDTGITLSLRPVDLNHIVHMVHDGLSTQVTDRQQTVTLELAPDLPHVAADRRYLHQALTRLVENAALYTPPGGSIAIRTFQSNGEVVIEINDTGIGIAAEDLALIFNRFYRVDKARAARGAGLGLPIAKKVIEQHQGRITAESTPGTGSTFRVFLPIVTT